LSGVQFFAITVTDNGPNPPNQDSYHVTLYDEARNALYDLAGDTTVGLGDLVVGVKAGN
jgi:hypothetical protein